MNNNSNITPAIEATNHFRDITKMVMLLGIKLSEKQESGE